MSSQEHFTARRRRIYLVRHGDTSYFDAEGRPVDPRAVMLSATGVEQARAMAELLAPIELDRVVCSGLPRTRQTAQIITDGRNLTIEDEPQLREIRGGRRLREIPEEDLEDALARAYHNAGRPGARFVGGDTYSEFGDRVMAAFMRLLDDRSWQALLVVAHDAVNRVLLCWAAMSHLGALPSFEQDTACLNVIDIDGDGQAPGQRILRLVNHTPYDSAKHQLHLRSMERIFLGYRPTAVNEQ